VCFDNAYYSYDREKCIAVPLNPLPPIDSSTTSTTSTSTTTTRKTPTSDYFPSDNGYCRERYNELTKYDAITQPFGYCGDEAIWSDNYKWWSWTEPDNETFKYCRKPATALIRLNTNKLIYGIVSYGSNEGLITRINLKRETTYGAYETVGQFDLDSTSPESRRCFGTPFQAGSMLVEIEAYEGRFEFNFNLLVQN